MGGGGGGASRGAEGDGGRAIANGRVRSESVEEGGHRDGIGCLAVGDEKFMNDFDGMIVSITLYFVFG